jgi:hypothetical protein
MSASVYRSFLASEADRRNINLPRKYEISIANFVLCVNGAANAKNKSVPIDFSEREA